MFGYTELTVVYVLMATYATYFNQMLQIKWRQWLTAHYVENWLSKRAYYNISLRQNPGQIVDNPDQRIAEDLRDFTANTLALGVDFITNVVHAFQLHLRALFALRADPCRSASSSMAIWSG